MGDPEGQFRPLRDLYVENDTRDKIVSLVDGEY